MGSYIEESKNTIKWIIDEFTKKFKKTELLKFAYVGYRDHGSWSQGWDSDYPVQIFDFSDGNSCINFIKGIKAGGGGDTPEAVVDSFYAVT